MRRRSPLLPSLLVLVLVLTGFLPGIVSATTRQVDTNTYSSPQFGYVVAWGTNWAARERDSLSIEDGTDTLVLSSNAGRVQVIGQEADDSAGNMLMTLVAEVTSSSKTVEITSHDPAAEVPTATVTGDNTTYLIEVHTLDNVLVATILSARASRFDQALDEAGTIFLNDTLLFSGEPAAPTAELPDTGTPVPDAETRISGTTFASDLGFTVEWDDSWTPTEFIQPDFELLGLERESGAIIVAGTVTYTGDATACLEGLDTGSGTESPEIEDWEIAEDENGDEIYQASPTFASGTFTYTFGTGPDSDLVDYIECRTLEPENLTLMIVITATRDNFADHLAASLEITNAIAMPAGAELAEPSDPPLPVFSEDTPDEPDATEQPDATPAPEEDEPETTGESGLDGATFTSPGFGFTLDIPDGWTVESESITAGDESLQLSNGTSLITVRASSSLPLELDACVVAVKAEAAEDPAYADLALDMTADGDPFRGADDRGAYALFTYTGADGEEQAWFVHCQSLVEDESVLVIVQDVPAADYITERQARRLIQFSIDLP